jgi:hypothetical protein
MDTKIPILPVVYPLPQISPLKLSPFLVLKQLSILSIQMGIAQNLGGDPENMVGF